MNYIKGLNSPFIDFYLFKLYNTYPRGDTMVTEIIRTKHGVTVVKYDPTKYAIKANYILDTLELIRLSNNEDIKSFSSDTKFIIQNDKDNLTHFFVMQQYGLDNKDGDLTHYIDKGSSYFLCPAISVFDVKNFKLLECQITDGSYLLDRSRGKFIMNVNGLSDSYEYAHVFENKGKKLVIVGKKIKTESNEDYIIYVVDPETGKTVSNIWSRKQQRYIPCYTKKQAEAYAKAESNKSFRKEYPMDNMHLNMITIKSEVKDKLLKLDEILGNTPEELYMTNDEINPDFVKKLLGKKNR